MSRISLSDLNDKQRGMIAPEVRATLGKAAITTAEAVAAAEDKAERELQGEIANYLRLHDIQFIRPDMRKRSPLPEGWPDFTFAYRGVPVALESKTPTGKLSAVQEQMHIKLKKDGWRVVVVRGLPEVQILLRFLDAQMNAVERTIGDELKKPITYP